MSAIELGLPLIDISGPELTLRSLGELRTPLVQLIGGSIDLPCEQPSPEGCTVERDGQKTRLRFAAATIPRSVELGCSRSSLASPASLATCWARINRL